MARRGDAGLHRRLARCLDDWGAPIGGQRIVDYDDQDLRVFKRRANTRPVFFRAQRTASADESLIVWHLRGHECPKNHPLGLSIVQSTNA
jgi:hypothetical protein